jgi:tetratricopeptide (TPR) repeat protein
MKDPAVAVPESDILPLKDHSICNKCRGDFGDQDLPLVNGMPTCKACQDAPAGIRIPAWILVSGVTCIALTVASYIHSYRFVRGYIQFQRANAAYKRDQIQEAAKLMSEAAQRVPEEAGFRDLACYFRGLELVRTGKAAEAIPVLKESLAIDPQSKETKWLLVSAERQVAFEAKDYGKFLQKSEEFLKLAGPTYDALSRMASAFACQYVVTEDEAYRANTLEHLAKAKAAKDFDQADFQVFENHLQFRLASREIISTQTFRERFPQGWKATKP